MLGPAPIVDFDGTIARLPVDWSGLRRKLGILSIEELWDGEPSRWDVITAAEVAAASSAEPVRPVIDAILDAAAFAVFTSNASDAVRTFLARHPPLEERASIIVGRDELGGSKRDFRMFTRGLHMCLMSTSAAREQTPPVFVGDSEYELRLAANLGLRVFTTDEIILSAGGRSR